MLSHLKTPPLEQAELVARRFPFATYVRATRATGIRYVDVTEQLQVATELVRITRIGEPVYFLLTVAITPLPRAPRDAAGKLAGHFLTIVTAEIATKQAVFTPTVDQPLVVRAQIEVDPEQVEYDTMLSIREEISA